MGYFGEHDQAITLALGAALAPLGYWILNNIIVKPLAQIIGNFLQRVLPESKFKRALLLDAEADD